MRDRHITIPILILDPMLPGQCLEFGSADPKFQKLIDHVLDSQQKELGMIGLNPHTGRPLNLGVRIRISCVLMCKWTCVIYLSQYSMTVGYMFLDRKQGQAGSFQ